MFGPAGHLYVYRSYGMHFCMNVSYGPVGIAGGVLLRAGEVLDGCATCPGAPAPRARDPRSGRAVPATSGSATGVTLAENGAALFESDSPVRLEVGRVGRLGEWPPGRGQHGRRPAVAASGFRSRRPCPRTGRSPRAMPADERMG